MFHSAGTIPTQTLGLRELNLHCLHIIKYEDTIETNDNF